MKTITFEEFVARLNARGGCCPVTILTRTQPALRKTGNPFAERGVERIARRNGFVGGDYESIANNKQERAGEARDFEAMPLPWGQHAGRFFIEHKGARYLKFFPIQTGCAGVDEWRTCDGQPLTLDDVRPFLPKHHDAPSGVPWRTIALTNIEEIVIDGETLRLASEKMAEEVTAA